VNTLAVKPDDQNTLLAGFATGGIFKSTDAGLNWHPVFDDNIDLAIGSLAFSSLQPNVVYAGTGDANMPSILFNGNGIYKSTDTGETWQYLGLAEAGIVSKIVLHPTNPQILFAATMGNPYVRDAARGVYRSTDGGQNWQQVLMVSNQAGASDLVINASNPQILYASFWDRIRNNHESVIYGPHARVYKSTDGGSSWTQLGGGLPTGNMGRTGLAISAQNPDKVYVVYIDTLSRPGALYKTVDGGQNWTSLNITALNDATGDFGWYFGKVTINPTNDEELYFHGVLLWRKPANSTGWLVASGGHSDSHDLVFTSSGRRYWANDGGVYRNEPNSMTWTKSKNLPATQLYRTDYNPTDPNNYYAGAQDNGILKGSKTDQNNWVALFPADGFHCAFHPTDANLFWIEIQNGAIHHTTDGGMNFIQGQPCLGSTDRCSWDTPFFISPHSPDKLYAGTYRAYASDNGASWGPISGDLTDGNIYGARFHTISCMDESPVQAEKLFAGTTDGNVWRREPNGTWANLTAGLPDRYVTSVHGSPTLSQRIFVTNSGFRDDEYIPHLHRSDNNGATWIDISGDLPQVPVNDLWIWPNHADSVLVAGTDAGVYLSKNGGNHWARLGGNMPYLPTFELELNVIRHELIAATFGRGIYTFPVDSLLSQAAPLTVSLAGNIKNESAQGVANVRMST
ncbi:MAG: sialidase family protein, partial [Saprospiraceae bacterium]